MWNYLVISFIITDDRIHIPHYKNILLQDKK